MNNRIIQTLLVAVGLTLASATVFAAKDDCPSHSWDKGQGYAAHFDKHMAKLHDALKLTPAQETAWTEFSTKIKPVKMDKPEHMDKSMHQDWENLSTPDRLDKMLDNMKTREQHMAEHAAATHKFYDTLTPDQKKIFDKHFQAFQRDHEHYSHGRHGHDHYSHDGDEGM